MPHKDMSQGGHGPQPRDLLDKWGLWVSEQGSLPVTEAYPGEHPVKQGDQASSSLPQKTPSKPEGLA